MLVIYVSPVDKLRLIAQEEMRGTSYLRPSPCVLHHSFWVRSALLSPFPCKGTEARSHANEFPEKLLRQPSAICAKSGIP